MARQCGNCGQTGHNVRTCKKQRQEDYLSSLPQEVDREAINGVKPKRGLWIVNPERQRIAGKILYVRKSGQVVYENKLGAHVESEQDTIERSGYQYVELEPKMLAWAGNGY